MNEDLRNEMKATINAAIPCLAIHSVETGKILEDITHHAIHEATNEHNNDAVAKLFVWRVSVGF